MRQGNQGDYMHFAYQEILARIFLQLPAATADTTVLPVVLGSWALRRTVQVRLGPHPLRLPGGTPLSTVSRRQLVKHPGLPVIFPQLPAATADRVDDCGLKI